MNDIHAATRNFHVIIYDNDTNLTSPMCSFSLESSVKIANIVEISSNMNNELSEIQEWLVTITECKINTLYNGWPCNCGC